MGLGPKTSLNMKHERPLYAHTLPLRIVSPEGSHGDNLVLLVPSRAIAPMTDVKIATSPEVLSIVVLWFLSLSQMMPHKMVVPRKY